MLLPTCSLRILPVRERERVRVLMLMPVPEPVLEPVPAPVGGQARYPSQTSTIPYNTMVWYGMVWYGMVPAPMPVSVPVPYQNYPQLHHCNTAPAYVCALCTCACVYVCVIRNVDQCCVCASSSR